MYEIQSNVPLPKIMRPRIAYRYPFDGMSVGDRFVVPLDEADGDAVKLRRRLQGAKAHAQQRLGHKFAVRAVEGGFGVWRIE